MTYRFVKHRGIYFPPAEREQEASSAGFLQQRTDGTADPSSQMPGKQVAAVLRSSLAGPRPGFAALENDAISCSIRAQSRGVCQFCLDSRQRPIRVC
jgi:hypothetical protein